MRDVVLLAHIGVGALGLVLGPACLFSPPGARDRLAAAYRLSVTVVAATAFGLVFFAPGLLWLVPVAVAMQAATVLGTRVRGWGWPNWPAWQAHLMGGSYVGLLTGLAVGSTGQPVFWVLPAVVAQLPIAIAKKRLSAGLPLVAPG